LETITQFVLVTNHLYTLFGFVLQVTAVLPSEISNTFVSGNYGTLFDVIISYSSLEHSGLTRYGDAPHPWGDLVTMAKNWCILNENGMAFIGIPTDQIDSIYFNAHR
jgi:hypothetical protein